MQSYSFENGRCGMSSMFEAVEYMDPRNFKMEWVVRKDNQHANFLCNVCFETNWGLHVRTCLAEMAWAVER